MKDDKNKTLVTAYIDSQLKSPEELRLFKKILQDDPSLEFDLNSELLTKKILKNKYSRKNMPDGRREELLEALRKENVKIAQRNSFKESFTSRRFISYSTAAVIILAFVLLLFNRPSVVSSNGISEQTGSNNMVVLAKQHFENYLNGNNSVQFISNDSRNIKDYFQSKGVNYATYIPELKKYSLVGASVSEHNGVKFAHHYYKSDDGRYIYVFQVHENYFRGDSIIRLSNDLMSYLKLGNMYRSSEEYYTIVMKHQDNNVIAMVSNMPAEEMPDEIFK